MKALNHIISDLEVLEFHGNSSVEVNYLSMDSRNIEPDTLFVAVRGVTVDGHHFINQSIDKGATVIVCEDFPELLRRDICYIKVHETSSALGYIASAYYGYPSQKLKLVGITGTNGKTTTASLLHETFRSLGFQVGLLSTVNNKVNDDCIPSTHTTPDQITLNSLLAQMVDQGCSHCFMEVSSHAVVQNRISALVFAGGVFTNITHDHLDYHKDFKSYRDVKKRFFDQLPATAFALSNADDPNGNIMLQNTRASKSYYSLRKPAEIKGVILENSMDGLLMRIGRQEIHLQLRGKFNAYNILAIFGTAKLLGQDEMEVLPVMSQLKHVDGRFHPIKNKKGVHAYVDYAHTPDAIENVMKTLDELRTRNETLFVVVGAGGNRDKTKRPVMAAIAARFADRLILTSDNPRNENPLVIIEEMKKGLDTFQLTRTLVIQDRKEAIKAACFMAEKGDIILVAGKGHETYQEIDGVKHPFDDKQILFEILNT
jgi:UDP-N-acetylmuramoyl-L-alanyl-D-glutamate--2,6-diaminopimelate ligase